MSGYTEDEMTFRRLAARQVPFLFKPFSPAALLRAVRQALDGSPPGPSDGGPGDRADAAPPQQEPRGPNGPPEG
jgi:hypothetical protein